MGFVGLCLLVGAANGAVTASSVNTWYRGLARPALTPPDWLFAPVWTSLYVLIGVAAWLVWVRVDAGLDRKRAALRLWGWQLLVNALWPPAFFGLHRPGLALAVLLVLLVLAGMTALAFLRLRRPAGLLMLPYLGWLCFATYLNIGFWWLN